MITVTMPFTVTEQDNTGPGLADIAGDGFAFSVSCPRGDIVRSWGPTRDLAIQGLAAFGFTVSGE